MGSRLSTTEPVVATTDAIVHDKILGMDRKVFAGQPVPPELVEAYLEDGGATRPLGETHEPGAVIANRTLTVHDDRMGIDRRLIGGQPVPSDLVAAYTAAIGGSETGDEPTGGEYADWKRPALEAEVDERELDITGTGAGGNVLVKDLVAALEADDAAKADGDPDPDGDPPASPDSIVDPEKED